MGMGRIREGKGRSGGRGREGRGGEGKERVGPILLWNP